MQERELPTAPLVAARAAESKKATDIRVLDLRGISSFTDYFVLCSGSNVRQIQTIADEIEAQLREHGERPLGVEGYDKADWVLADYGNFIVHIFSRQAREFYDLERLWRSAKEIKIPAEVRQ